MIDVHSHILPKIDDGAQDVNESINMIKEAYQTGFKEIISTSHYIEESYTVSKSQREELIDMLQRKLEEENIDVKIYNGAEVYITPNLLDLLKQGEIATINNTKYLLIELPMNNEIIYLDKVIFDLTSYGIVPIIAHPERYSYVQENPKMLIDLIKKGVLFQANYGSVLGFYGKSAQKTVIKLLKRNMIHLLGTDAHNADSIYVRNGSNFKKNRQNSWKE